MAYNNHDNSMLELTTTPITALPLTLAAFGAAGAGTVLILANKNYGYDGDSFSIGASNSMTTSVHYGRISNSIAEASGTRNGYAHAAGTFTTNSLRTAYFNGGNKTSNTATQTTVTPTVIGIGAYRRTPLASKFIGPIAEVAGWSVVLSDEEIASLAKGFRPFRVRPQSLQFYLPLVRAIAEIRRGIAFEQVGTSSVADHPRVY